MRIAFSYNGSSRHVTEKYLSESFDPGCVIHFDLDLFRSNVSVLRLLDLARTRSELPDVFAHLVHSPGLPRDLEITPIPTVSLDIDSFGWTSSRIRWSMLFDYVFLWHKSFVPLYEAAGHPKVSVLPHAVDAELFRESQCERDRPLELGWVGEFGYGHYARRRRIVEKLSTTFRMNDFRKRYGKEETAGIYQLCNIVVNISREDFPQEANMRCYEGMAGGALLITGIPTELTEWGFREGEHFIGWRDEEEISDLVDYYLRNQNKRCEIALAGQKLTLDNFTFQRCKEEITAVLGEYPNQFFAPARSWQAEDIHLTYLEYYYRYQLLGAALEEFAALRKANRRASWKGLPMVLKTLRNSIKSSLI